MVIFQASRFLEPSRFCASYDSGGHASSRESFQPHAGAFEARFALSVEVAVGPLRGLRMKNSWGRWSNYNQNASLHGERDSPKF